MDKFPLLTWENSPVNRAGTEGDLITRAITILLSGSVSLHTRRCSNIKPDRSLKEDKINKVEIEIIVLLFLSGIVIVVREGGTEAVL